MTGWIAISLGDVTGIGPEVTLKALAAEAEQDDTRYLLIGDSEHTAALYEKLGLHFPLQPFSEFGAQGRFFLHHPLPESLPPGLAAGSPAAARAAAGEPASIFGGSGSRSGLCKKNRPFAPKSENGRKGDGSPSRS